MSRVLKAIMVISLALMSAAAEAQSVEMADNFRGEGKIYVVIAVLVLILVGIGYALFGLDRKIKKIEKEIEGRQ